MISIHLPLCVPLSLHTASFLSMTPPLGNLNLLLSLSLHLNLLQSLLSDSLNLSLLFRFHPFLSHILNPLDIIIIIFPFHLPLIPLHLLPLHLLPVHLLPLHLLPFLCHLSLNPLLLLR
ncbi:hypothetical protein FPQ18DRAFT_60326 [Pyronema domesticum]|nr:hypothetical protein FPQ18DRAFT_60326 [Pyronema domesticum]